MSDIVEAIPAIATVATVTTNKSKRLKKEKVEKAPKEKKTKKEKVDKYNGFKVPAKDGPKSTKAVSHIYDMIKEAAPTLLERDDVRTAFNNFIDYLRKYDDILESWRPSIYNKYSCGVKIDESNKSYLHGLLFRYDYYQQNKNGLAYHHAIDVIGAYRPLYDLIKRDVVPYMEIKDWEIKSKKDIEYYHKQMEKMEQAIRAYENAIINTRKTMCDYAQRALALQTPPAVTKFD